MPYTSCIPAEYSLYSAGILFVYSPNTVCIQPEYSFDFKIPKFILQKSGSFRTVPVDL